MSAAAAVVSRLRALDDRSAGRRVAWTKTWSDERRVFFDELERLPGVAVHRDPAGNMWAVLKGESPATVVAGSHLDCVPGGGWLDGCLGVYAAAEALRVVAARDERPPLTLAVVDWADEEGARFGHSLLGSSAACGLLDVEAARVLRDADGVSLGDAMAALGVDIDAAPQAASWLENAHAYLELHIEQGPVLERAGRAAAAVSGCLGVRRLLVTLRGREAHAGAAPMDSREDPVLAAASVIPSARNIAIELGGLATTGILRASPGTQTAVAGSVELSFDMRNADLERLEEQERRVRVAIGAAAHEYGVTATAERVWAIDPVAFDIELVSRARAALAGSDDGERLVSGPLHDAAACARAGVPTAMMFVRSLGGVSHSREEDSAEEDLVAGIEALVSLVVGLVDG